MNVKQIMVLIEELGGIESSARQNIRIIVKAIVEVFLSKDESRNDVGMLNRFVEALSPANRRMVVAFFRTNGPFAYDTERELFGKKVKKDTAIAKRMELMQSFLERGGDIWSEGENASTAPKRSRKERLVSAITTGLKDTKDGLTSKEVLEAAMEGGITVEDIITFLEAIDAVTVSEAQENVKQAGG